MKAHDAVLHNRQYYKLAASRSKRPRFKVIEPQQFRDARIYSGLDREAAAEFLGVTVRTIGHWETGYATPSYAAFRLLRVYRHGDLVHPAWAACKINRRGALVTPEGHEIQPTELAWLSLLVRRAAAMSELLRERETLKEQLQRLAGRGAALPAASAVGLVYTGTTHTDLGKSLLLPTFQAYCLGPIMGPQWGHESAQSQARNQEIQPADSYGSDGRGPGRGGCQGHQPQRLLPAGDRQLHSLHPAGPSPAGGAGEGGCVNKSARNNAYAEGGQERSLSLWQWEKGQVLSLGDVLTAGGVQ